MSSSPGNGKKEEEQAADGGNKKGELMESLSDELLCHVLSWLTPLELLQSVCLVSKRFARKLLQDHNDNNDDNDEEEGEDESSSFWRTCMSVPMNEISQRLTRHQLQRYCVFETTRKSSTHNDSNNNSTNDIGKDSDFAAKVPACLKYGSMLVFKSQIRHLHGNRVCMASTTDNQQDESLENVLPEPGDDDVTERFYTMMNRERHPLAQNRWGPTHQLFGPNLDVPAAAAFQDPGLFLVRIPTPNNPAAAPRWWSSRPMPSQDGRQERLLFTLRYPECLISEVWIKPMRDPYVGFPVYSWKQTKIQAYRLPLRILGKTRREIGQKEDRSSPRRNSGTLAAATAAAASSSSSSSRTLNVKQKHGAVENDIDMTTNDRHPKPMPLLFGSWQQHSGPHNYGGVLDDDHDDVDEAQYLSNPATNGGIVQISRRRLMMQLPPEERANGLTVAPDDDIALDLLLHGQVPVYESTEMPHPLCQHEAHLPHHSTPANSSKLMKFALPPGVVANVIVVTLIGKNHKQFEGSGYYACVERVDCRGIPLYAHQSVQL